MSREDATGRLAHWGGTLGSRVLRAWRVLPHERRLAAGASLGLFVALFLPWYQETVIVPGAKSPTSASASLTGWSAFSFVEAAVLLVALGVLTLLFHRAEGRAFHLPGGDGWVIMAAGAWTCALVIWRIFDKQSTSIHGPGATISGIEWGILVALAVSGLLAYSGSRIRAAHRPEPPLPGGAPVVPDSASPPVPVPDLETEPMRREPPAQANSGLQRRPVGWLTARPAAEGNPQPRPVREPGREAGQGRRRRPGGETARRSDDGNEDQLTIPLEPED